MEGGVGSVIGIGAKGSPLSAGNATGTAADSGVGGEVECGCTSGCPPGEGGVDSGGVLRPHNTISGATWSLQAAGPMPPAQLLRMAKATRVVGWMMLVSGSGVAGSVRSVVM